MISLAPFFLTFMLFSQTKSLFDNWLSTLFSYMIQPTILLVFFLLIDQIMSAQLAKAVMRACWDILISIKIGVDFNHIGIPLSFSFSLPFLPGIPFYVPAITSITGVTSFNVGGSFLTVATSSLLFYSYCLMSYGLVEYVTIVISQLTNVMPARQEGNVQEAANPTESIMHDVVSPFTGAAKGAGNTFKEKVIDQKYRARPPAMIDESDRKTYTNKIFSGSRHDSKDDEL
jgi:type IV secretion system protein VirB6